MASDALMNLALEQAARARGRTSPNPMVGCVIAKRGQVIATAYHRRAGSPHAEVLALRSAGARARGADVYVNLEPCNHQGRTGPCCDALIEAGVRRVFVSIRDPNPRVDGRGIRRLRRAGIEVITGVLADRARRLNEPFLHRMRTGRPFVVVKLAQSLDGRVATRTGESKWITGAPARRVGHALRGSCDAIVVGVGTVLADDPQLTCRIRGGRDPLRIVLDSRARTPTGASVIRVSSRSQASTLIAVGPDATPRRVRALERAGAEVLRCRAAAGGIRLDDVLDHILARGGLSLLVEGGPTVIGSVFDAGCVDKVHAFIAPSIIGGVGALGAVGGRGSAALLDRTELVRVETEQLGRDLHLVGYPRPGA